MDLTAVLLQPRELEGVVDAILYYHAQGAHIDDMLATKPNNWRTWWNETREGYKEAADRSQVIDKAADVLYQQALRPTITSLDLDTEPGNERHINNLGAVLCRFIELPLSGEPGFMNFYHFLYTQYALGQYTGREEFMHIMQESQLHKGEMVKEIERFRNRRHRLPASEYAKMNAVVESLLFFHVFGDNIDPIIEKTSNEVKNYLLREIPSIREMDEKTLLKRITEYTSQQEAYFDRFMEPILADPSIKSRKHGSRDELVHTATTLFVEITSGYAPFLIRENEGLKARRGFGDYLLRTREKLREELKRPFS